MTAENFDIHYKLTIGGIIHCHSAEDRDTFFTRQPHDERSHEVAVIERILGSPMTRKWNTVSMAADDGSHYSAGYAPNIIPQPHNLEADS